MLVFGERGKPEYPEKNLSEQEREQTNEDMSMNKNQAPCKEFGEKIDRLHKATLNQLAEGLNKTGQITMTGFEVY